MDITHNFNIPYPGHPIALIGAGGIVKDAHLPAYQKAGFNVKAIYDLNIDKARKLAKDFEVPIVCTDLNDLIAVAQANQCLYDLALPASAILSVLPSIPDESGVLIQKPMGEDLDQAKAILALCRQKKLIAGINFQLRHAPYIKMAKDILDQGLIGQLHDMDIRLNVDTPWHLWDFMFDLPRTEILYHSIHYIDLIRYFLGNPKRVLAKTTKHPNMPELASTRSSIIMDYGDVIRANINTNHGHQFGLKHMESYIKFEGTTGAIKIRMGVYLNYPQGLPDEFEWITLEDNQGWQKKNIQGSWFPEAFIGPMAGLMNKMNDPSDVYINAVEDAIHTMEVVEQCYRSSEG